ncbi:MAG: hypothetical protein AB7Q81_24985 [Gammaproteobacteria bacterium]
MTGIIDSMNSRGGLRVSRRRRRRGAAWLTVALLLSTLCWHCPLVAATPAAGAIGHVTHCGDEAGAPIANTVPCEHCDGGDIVLPPGASPAAVAAAMAATALPVEPAPSWLAVDRPAPCGRAPPLPPAALTTPLARAERLLV